MRFTSVVALVFLLLIASVSFCQEASLPAAESSAEISASASSGLDLPFRPAENLFADSGQANRSRPVDILRGSRHTHTLALDGDQNDVCYKMRTYVVARESRDSDAVRPVAYFTCLPGAKVEMKSSDMKFIPPK